MGVSLPSIPISSSEDNINLGDKDSIRRRALWALEGKDAKGTFSVEIPELDVPEAPKRSIDFRECFHYLLPVLSFMSVDSHEAILPAWHRSRLRRRTEHPDGQQA